MKVTLLAPDLHSNSLIGPYLFAKALSPRHDVEIWGPCPRGRRVWEVLSPMDLPCRALRLPRQLPTRADAAIAFNAMPASLGLGLWLRSRTGTPLVFYASDLDSAYPRPPWAVLDVCRARLLEGLVVRADFVASSSSALQRRFGGALIPQGCDTDLADPDRFDPAACRAELGLEPGLRYILFQGQLLPHKGVEDLVDVFRRKAKSAWRLLFVGGSSDRRFLGRFLKRIEGEPAILRRPWSRYSDSPRYLAAVDAVVIPQRGWDYARAQMPLKLYQAMAMEKPIIASAVSDIPEVLEGCGILTPPGDHEALGRALERLMDDPALGRSLGKRARRRCIERCAFPAIRPLLEEALKTARRRFKSA